MARSSTSSRPPPTPPSASTCGATRSTGSPSSPSTTSAAPTTSPRCGSSRLASCCPATSVRARAAALVAEEPWGREQWERLAEGTLSSTGWRAGCRGSSTDDTLITDLLPAAGKVVLVEPRRMRDRANDLLAEEDDLARSLASTWARDADRKFPACTPDTDRLLGTDAAHVDPELDTREPGCADGGSHRLGSRRRRRRGSGKATGGAARRQVPRRRRCGRRRVGASGWPSCCATAGLDFTIATATTDITKPGGYVVAAPLHRGCLAPSGQVGDRRRRRPHRPATHPPPAATAQTAGRGLLRGPEAGQLRRALPARRRSLRGHGQAHDRRHRARLPAARRTRVATSCTCPAIRSTRCASTSAARRPRCTASVAPTSRRPSRGCVARCARSPRNWWCCTRSGSTRRDTPSAATLPWQARDGGRVPVRRDARPAKVAIDDVKVDMERAYPMDRLAVRRRRLRQDRGRDPGRVQGDPGRQAGRRAGADHAARDPARQHVRRSVRRLSRSASRRSAAS